MEKKAADSSNYKGKGVNQNISKKGKSNSVRDPGPSAPRNTPINVLSDNSVKGKQLSTKLGQSLNNKRPRKEIEANKSRPNTPIILRAPQQAEKVSNVHPKDNSQRITTQPFIHVAENGAKSTVKLNSISNSHYVLVHDQPDNIIENAMDVSHEDAQVNTSPVLVPETQPGNDPMTS